MQYPWLLSVALLLISLPSWANWQFVPEHSVVYAVSTKSQGIAEVHQFAIAHAKLTPQGKFSMALELASVMSGIEHRNQLLQDVLFEVAKYPRATLTAEVAEQWLAELPVAKVVLMSLPAKLQLHGVQQELELQLSVVKLSEQQIWVTNAKPLILNLNTFGFAKGLHKLAQLSSLESIAAMTPMNFSLLLEK